ncbi:hypothetical protein KC949_00370 [Candidatus Saccharibacteria bacterium]|jgi:hypothetical protein|nr:hypothetical protein [Candidatus Saccharibacteria bacterium]
MNSHYNERGAVSGMLVAVVFLAVAAVGLGVFGIWAYVSYNEAQGDVEGKIEIAVAQAKQDQSQKDNEDFAERLKTPYKQFKGPEDYCSLRFQYPQNWSEYWSERVSNGGDFKAFLNPEVVPPVSSDQQFALRVLIEQKDYDKVIGQYRGLTTSGKLTQSSTNADGKALTRLTGDFSNDIRGDAVIFRCRDKTITIRTDAEKTFKNDFETLIRTIKFNS